MFSKDDKIHIPHLRPYGHGAEIRRTLSLTPEHPQREDLRFSVVMVRVACGVRPGSTVFCIVMVVLQVLMYLLRAKSPLAPQNHIGAIYCNFQICDLFVHYKLGKNINPLVYKVLVADLAYNFEEKETV